MSETKDQARTRRRWITLAEFVAVAGLLIGALTLYLNWAERREERADRAAETAAERAKAATLALAGTVAGDGTSIALADPAHEIAEASARLPADFGGEARDAMPGPNLPASWIAPPVLKLTDGGPDVREGRVPVLLTIAWWDGDTKRQTTGLYDLLWRTEGQFLGGRKLTLTGFTRRARTATPADLAAAWTKERRRLAR